MAIPFRQCAFSIDLRTRSEEFFGGRSVHGTERVLSPRHETARVWGGETFRVGATANLHCKTSSAGCLLGCLIAWILWRYAEVSFDYGWEAEILWSSAPN